MTIGLAFSGGGIRSLAQIATLDHMNRQGIYPHAVAGTSMGAVIAALTACNFTPTEMENIVLRWEKELDDTKLWRRLSPRVLPFSRQRIDGFIYHKNFAQFCEKSFSALGFSRLKDVRLPLAIVTIRVRDGRLTVLTNYPEAFRVKGFTNGVVISEDVSLGAAVAASCAYPLVFSSAEFLEDLYVDGGLRMNAPVEVFEPRVIHRVGVLTQHEKKKKDPETSTGPYTLMSRSLEILARQNEEYALRRADGVYNVDVGSYSTFDIGKGKEIIHNARRYIEEHPFDYRGIRM